MTAVAYAHPTISRFAIADGMLHIGGLHHQLTASRNFGHVVRKNYPVTMANRMGVPGAETVSVVGCSCTPLALLARGVCPPRAEIGDLVAVFLAGAHDGAVGVDRRPPGLHDRSGEAK
jgi:diaminopimelate decarboxylase